MNAIGQAGAALAAELSALRRELHQNPELASHEHRTAAKIAELLIQMGCEVQQNVGGTGVIGILRNGEESPVVALRADMDALPITEEANHNYISKNPGVMHACGHDAHMTCLIGAMRILAQHRDCWHGTVKAIFQPAEEIVAGARDMIREGVM
ncbi:MAG: M20 metallopeptidase family protein, partial [Bacillota bacterium]